MAEVVAFSNQKGGVGKTTSTYNLGVALADIGEKVLLVDLDPQAGMTFYAGFEPDDLTPTIYDCLIRNRPANQAILTNKYGVDLLPANIDLAEAELKLVHAVARERRVTKIINEVRSSYSYILMDCQPSLGLLTYNALAAADKVIIPVSCEYLSIRGTTALLRFISIVRGQLNSHLEIAGILPTMFDTRTNHARDILQTIKTRFADIPLYPCTVNRSIRFAESTAERQPIFESNVQVPGALAYRELARTLVKSSQTKQQG